MKTIITRVLEHFGPDDVDKMNLSWNKIGDTIVFKDSDDNVLASHKKGEDVFEPHLESGETIEYLEKLIVNKTILEFGSGESTIWLGRRAKTVYTVEDNHQWMHLVNAWIALEDLNNVFMMWKRPLDLIPFRYFDVVLVDNGDQGQGPCYDRLATAALATYYVKPDGVIMIDDQSWDHFRKAGELVESYGWKSIATMGLQKTMFYKK